MLPLNLKAVTHVSFVTAKFTSAEWSCHSVRRIPNKEKKTIKVVVIGRAEHVTFAGCATAGTLRKNPSPPEPEGRFRAKRSKDELQGSEDSGATGDERTFRFGGVVDAVAEPPSDALNAVGQAGNGCRNA